MKLKPIPIKIVDAAEIVTQTLPLLRGALPLLLNTNLVRRRPPSTHLGRSQGRLAGQAPPANLHLMKQRYVSSKTTGGLIACALAFASQSATAQTSRPLAEQRASSIGYPTVAAALGDLRSRSDVTFEQQNGWTIATDRKNFTIWSFSPPQSPTYPAAVKRVLQKGPQGVYMDMTVSCIGSKAACDDLVRSFEKLNAEVSKAASAQSR